jgi:[ribosomal protein S5]-alanine N-acetyltransferase
MLLTCPETPRLIIRDVLPSDVYAFFGYMKREQYWRDIPIDPPTLESIKGMVDRCLSNQEKEPRTNFFLAAVAKATGELIGEAGLYIRSLRSQQGEIGWGVGQDHVGHGFATEIGSAILNLAFDRFSLHRVYAQCRVENQASRRIMAKLGMREEGLLRENVLARGSWWSSVQCSILSSERAVLAS